MAIVKASIKIVDRFDDNSLPGWTIEVGGTNRISQVTESKTIGAITYNETRVDFTINDTSYSCRMYRSLGASVSKLSYVIDLLLPSTPTTAGNVR